MSVKKYTYYANSIWKLLTGMRPWSRVLVTFLRPGKAKEQVIELRSNGLRFKTRGVMDIWSVKETFLDRFYERFSTSIGEDWTIVDIGGGIGDFTIFATANHPKNIVYTFEPTPDSFRLLQENLRQNQIKNVQTFPQAIWSRDGHLTIDTTVGEPGQFISKEIARGAEDISQQSEDNLLVPSMSLAQAFEITGLARCNLMKIDCEGAEFEILFNAPAAVLDRVERIVMEYHDGITEYTHKDLVDFLRKNGYAVKVHPNYVHADLGYLYACR